MILENKGSGVKSLILTNEQMMAELELKIRKRCPYFPHLNKYHKIIIEIDSIHRQLYLMEDAK